MAHSCARASCTSCCSWPPCLFRPSALVSPLGLRHRFLLACNCALTGPLAGAGVRVSALTTHRQRPAMAVATIALDVDKALDVHRDVFAEIAFAVSFVLNHLTEAVDL